MAGLLRLREIILNIAYKACEGKNNLLDSPNFTYNRAIRLISAVLILHLGQLAVIVFHDRLFPMRTFSGVNFFVSVAVCAMLIFMMYVVFPKKILNMDGQSSVESVVWHPKLLAFSYFFFNLILLLFLAIHFDKMAKLRVGILFKPNVVELLFPLS